MKVYAVLLAGGSGTRMNLSINKILLPVHQLSPVRRCLDVFSGLIDQMVIVCREEDRAAVQNEAYLCTHNYPVHYACGGKTRQESVYNGLLSFQFQSDDIVLIHDAARCLVTKDVIRRVIASVMEHGSGIPVIPVTDTVKLSEDHEYVSGTPDRNRLFSVQTPQGFKAFHLLEASESARKDHFEGTDDSSLMERVGYRVHMTDGSKTNIKLTTQEDLLMAESILSGGNNHGLRIGHGFDVHRLTEGRDLVLCGLTIPSPLGLLGHSDADVALHALMDAMLGAAALGDIGSHFPDTDEQYKGISSVFLLQKTNELLIRNGFHVSNVDITIIAQRPKLRNYISSMCKNVAAALGCDESVISVKATTTEGLGYEGHMEGISAHAVCMLTHSA